MCLAYTVDVRIDATIGWRAVADAEYRASTAFGRRVLRVSARLRRTLGFDGQLSQNSASVACIPYPLSSPSNVSVTARFPGFEIHPAAGASVLKAGPHIKRTQRCPSRSMRRDQRRHAPQRIARMPLQIMKVRQAQVRHPLQQRFQRGFQLERRKTRAEAIVNAAAEHDRPVRVFRPLDDQLVRLIEVRRVAGSRRRAT